MKHHRVNQSILLEPTKILINNRNRNKNFDLSNYDDIYYLYLSFIVDVNIAKVKFF